MDRTDKGDGGLKHTAYQISIMIVDEGINLADDVAGAISEIMEMNYGDAFHWVVMEPVDVTEATIFMDGEEEDD